MRIVNKTKFIRSNVILAILISSIFKCRNKI